jgi:large subunit ribosomal protein L9
MKVVFLEEVEGTARTGDVKNVANGFARNFLLPRKLAAPATDHYISIAQARATKEVRKQSKLDEDAQKLLPKIDGQELTVEVRVGEQEKLFGSVTAREIAEMLVERTKIELEHRQVDLKQPLRELGTFKVPVKLTRNVIATVTVNVTPVGGVTETAAPEAEAEEPEAEAEAQMGDASEAAEPAEETPIESVAEEARAEPVEGDEEQAAAEENVSEEG